MYRAIACKSSVLYIRLPCLLELKNQFKAGDVYKIASMIEKAGYLEHVTFISFALKNLIYLRRRYPQQPAQFLIKDWDDRVLAGRTILNGLRYPIFTRNFPNKQSSRCTVRCSGCFAYSCKKGSAYAISRQVTMSAPVPQMRRTRKDTLALFSTPSRRMRWGRV